jgi:hypothetical protein
MSEIRVTLLVRVTARLKSQLVGMAEAERRSLSKQVELLLERCVAQQSEEMSARPPSVPRAKTGKKRRSSL